MVKYLVDANVLSEATKPQPAQRAMDWIRTHRHSILLSPVVLAELEYGILLLPSGRKRTKLLQWLENGVKTLPVVPIDGATSSEWATLVTALRKQGRSMPIKDSVIAASARQHQITIATRNVADFRHAGVPVVDPFAVT
jgi:predicted nucleic acid-binding protein